jgi:exodeoxyribonuclease VII small subunit
MEKKLTYNEAFDKLEAIVEEIEDDTILLDTLNDKVKEAKELINYCENKLRGIETEINKTLKG